MRTPDEIVLATSNPHKVEEMNAIFGSLESGPLVRFLSLAQACPGITFREPAETGDTFEDNATIKAVGYARQTGRVCLADDSGLEIDALGGRPGVISSHYATDGRETGIPREARDSANNQRVLRELLGVPDEARSARFVCVMVLAGPDGRVLATSRGTFEGRIGHSLRGTGGFGYDPMFLVGPDYTRSSAELPPAEKNRLSHRGAAARQLAALLSPPRA